MQSRQSEMQVAPEEPWPTTIRSGYILALLCVTYLVSYVDRSLLNLLTEPIKADLGLSDTQVSLLQGFAVAVFFGLAGLPIGWLADRANRVRLIGVGTIVWSLATGACGLAGSFWSLFAARMAVGVGEASVMPSTYSILPDIFPPHRLGRATALFSMGGALGAGVGMIAGGALIAALTLRGGMATPFGHLAPWQAAFLIMSLPGLLLAALTLLTLAEPKRRAAARARSVDAEESLVPLLKGNAATFAALFLSFPFATFIFNGWVAWLPSLLIRSYGQTPASAAMVMGTIFLVFGIAGVLSGGALGDRLVRGGMRDAPMRLSVVALAGLGVTGGLAPLMGSMPLFLALFGAFVFLGSYLSIAPIVSMQMFVPNRLRARLSALFLLIMTLFGSGLGPTGVALITDRIFMDEARLGHSLSLATAVLMSISAAILILGLKPYRRSLDLADADTQRPAGAPALAAA